MAQLGARLNGIEEVVGSSPTRSTGLIEELAERLALLVKSVMRKTYYVKNLNTKSTKKHEEKLFFLFFLRETSCPSCLKSFLKVKTRVVGYPAREMRER